MRATSRRPISETFSEGIRGDLLDFLRPKRLPVSAKNDGDLVIKNRADINCRSGRGHKSFR